MNVRFYREKDFIWTLLIFALPQHSNTKNVWFFVYDHRIFTKYIGAVYSATRFNAYLEGLTISVHIFLPHKCTRSLADAAGSSNLQNILFVSLIPGFIILTTYKLRDHIESAVALPRTLKILILQELNSLQLFSWSAFGYRTYFILNRVMFCETVRRQSFHCTTILFLPFRVDPHLS
jgi:hypothetical protein